MIRPDGTKVGIPYSNVPAAQQQGFQLVGHTFGTGDSGRYWKDYDAAQARPKTLGEWWERGNSPMHFASLRDQIAYDQAVAKGLPESDQQKQWDHDHPIRGAIHAAKEGVRSADAAMWADAEKMFLSPLGAGGVALGGAGDLLEGVVQDARVGGAEIPKVLQQIQTGVRNAKGVLGGASATHGAHNIATKPGRQPGESYEDYTRRIAADLYEVYSGGKDAFHAKLKPTSTPEPEAPKPEPEAPKPDPQGSVGTGSEVSPPSLGATPASKPQLALPAPEPRLMLSDHTTTGEVQPIIGTQTPQPYPPLASDYAKMRTRRPRFPVPQVAPEWGGEITPAGVVVRPEPRMLPAPGRMADDATTAMFGDLGKRGEPIHSTSGQMPMTEPQLALPAPKPQLALPAPEPRLMLSDHGTAGDAQSMFYMKAPQPYPPLASNFARMRVTPPRIPVPQVVPEWGGEITTDGVVIRPPRLMLPAPTPGAQDMTSLKWNGQ